MVLNSFTREMSVYIAVMLDEVEYIFDTPTDSSDIRRLASHYKNSQIGDHHKLGIILYEYLQQPIGKDRTDWALKKGLHIDVLNRAGINSKRILTMMQREQIEVSLTPVHTRTPHHIGMDGPETSQCAMIFKTMCILPMTEFEA